MAAVVVVVERICCVAVAVSVVASRLPACLSVCVQVCLCVCVALVGVHRRGLYVSAGYASVSKRVACVCVCVCVRVSSFLIAPAKESDIRFWTTHKKQQTRRRLGGSAGGRWRRVHARTQNYNRDLRKYSRVNRYLPAKNYE